MLIEREVTPVKYSELYKRLREIKCCIVREGANHSMWYSPVTGKTFPVSHHKGQEVPTGTLKSIERDSGLQ